MGDLKIAETTADGIVHVREGVEPVAHEKHLLV
jgi:hypothetical protein